MFSHISGDNPMTHTPCSDLVCFHISVKQCILNNVFSDREGKTVSYVSVYLEDYCFCFNNLIVVTGRWSLFCKVYIRKLCLATFLDTAEKFILFLKTLVSLVA